MILHVILILIIAAIVIWFINWLPIPAPFATWKWLLLLIVGIVIIYALLATVGIRLP